MKEIKKFSKELEVEAYENVEGFEFNDLCFKSVFEVFNNAGVFVKAFNELTTYDIQNKNQIKLMSFKYGFVLEEDGQAYPMVDMYICIKDKVSPFQTYFAFTLTPFNARMNNILKDGGVWGGCDKELTRCWRLFLKNVFGDKWLSAFRKYCEDIKSLKESEVATRAEQEYFLIDKKFEEEINSI